MTTVKRMCPMVASHLPASEHPMRPFRTLLAQIYPSVARWIAHSPGGVSAHRFGVGG